MMSKAAPNSAAGGLPAWVEPQLATLTKDRFSDPAWIFERKLDGERCLAFADRDGEAYWRQACRNGWEGVIAKRAAASYRGGRSRAWLKFKCLNAQEFAIGGYTDPQGSRRGFGALLLGYYDGDGRLVYAGKVGTGFDHRMLDTLHAALTGLECDRPAFERGKLPRTRVHWVEPRLVAQIAFAEWTRGGQLRQPRFQGLRKDKDAADAVRETP